MVSRPTDEKLRRFAWTYNIDDVLPLYEFARKQLSKLGVSWENARAFPSTTERLGTYDGAAWRRWIDSVNKDDSDGLQALSRFSSTCGLRLGQIATEGEDPLQRLVDSPQEKLGVELKPWLTATDKADAAKVAKACIALRNNDGGYLVLGFEDDGTPSPQPPSDLESTYHVDVIQQIVSKYASEPFAISVEMRESDGQRHPIVVVPSGLVTPVFAKSTLNDPTDEGKRLIEDDTIYVRSITSNNRVSSSKLRRSDIARLMKVCFDNREADIGAFFRRHLSGLSPNILQSAFAAVREPIEPKVTEYLDEGFERFTQSLAERGKQMPKTGFIEAAALLDKVEQPRPVSHESLFRLQSVRHDHSGWPPWTVITNPQACDLNPRVVQGKWEALMDCLNDSTHGAMLDYWQIDPSGRFYYVRTLEDDVAAQSRGVSPNTVLDFYLVVYRVTEIVSAVIQMARDLAAPNECEIELALRWRGLRGRVLTSWSEPGRRLRRQTTAYDEVVTTEISLPSDMAESAIPSQVYQAVRPVFLAFEGYDLPQEVIEGISSSVLGQRM